MLPVRRRTLLDFPLSAKMKQPASDCMLTWGNEPLQCWSVRPPKNLWPPILLLATGLWTGGCATLRQMQASRFLQRCDVELEAVRFRGVSLNEAPSTPRERKPEQPSLMVEVMRFLAIFLFGAQPSGVRHADVELHLRVQNRNQRAVWVEGFDGEVSLDDVVSAPVGLADKVMLRPGISTAVLIARVPLNERLFDKLADVHCYRLRGVVSILFPDRNQRGELEFDQQRLVPEKVRESLVSAKKLLMEPLF